MTKQEQRDQDQTEDKNLSSVRPKTTAQERRDLDYLDGYGVGASGTPLTYADYMTHSVAWNRGYRDGRADFSLKVRAGA
jgi:hypothetical protein